MIFWIRCGLLLLETLRKLDEILHRMNVAIAGTSPARARAAREACLRFGIGNRPAWLTFGDCFGCARSRLRGQPLLFKQGDFRLTDVEAAV